MAEQDEKIKKKPHTYGRVLGWTGLTVLSALIILALFFQAPWKVIALLLIILAACTVLPKPYKKWFWLSVAAIVVVLIIWVFLPDDNEGWRPYTFDEELAALEAKYAIPDSENAATIYNALLEDYDSNTMHPDFLDPNIEYLTLREFWSGKDHPELAKWIEDQQNTIAKLSEASKIARCAFPIPYDTFSFSDTIDHLPEIRGLAFLLIRAGNNDIAEGRIEEGLEKYLCVRKMGDHIRQQSTLVEMLVGIAVEALALGRFEPFVVTADATEEHLSLIEKAAVDIKYDWSFDLPRILKCEKLMAKNLVCGMAYEVHPDGRTRFSRDPVAAMRSEFPEELPPLTYWQTKLAKAGTVLGWFVMPSTPKKAAKTIDTAFKPLYEMANPDFDWEKEPTELSLSSIKFNYGFVAKLLVSMSEGTYYDIHDQYLRNIAEQRGTRVIIALRRYKNKRGRWPETLDGIKNLVPEEILVDPVNGGSFVYKLTEENFTLYSKGKNNIDEGGEYQFSWPQKAEPDDFLIWSPKKPKTTKEEKANDE
jgi:hypothetical protein